MSCLRLDFIPLKFVDQLSSEVFSLNLRPK